MRNLSRAIVCAVILMALMIPVVVTAGNNFADQAGPVSVGKVSSIDPAQVPYIFWAGDYALFYANGGLLTQPGSIFDKLGLKIKLVPGDDTYQQARDYVSGKSPFFRGTNGMAAMASEYLNQSPETQGILLVRETKSLGDHLVCKKNIRTIKDLGKATVAYQEGGPHVKFHREVLLDAKQSWDDSKIIATRDLTGTKDSPLEALRNNPDCDCAYLVTPDMIAATGGLQSVGTGSEGTIKGAHAVVSTAERTESILDNHYVRTDFDREHHDWVEKFVLGYLQASERIVEMRKQYETSGSAEYRQLLQLAIKIYGVKALPNEDEAHGFLLDAAFVGHPGNVKFFTQSNNPNGFAAVSASDMEFALRRGYVKQTKPFKSSTINWNSPLFMSNLKNTVLVPQERFQPKAVQAEIEKFTASDELDERTIYSFTINFEPNQMDFSESKYVNDFKEVMRLASSYPNAVVAVRGHADPSETLKDLVKAGMAKGLLVRTGSTGNWKYSLNGKPLDLGATAEMIQLIQAGKFDGVEDSNPRETMAATMTLSLKRAEAVRQAVLDYAAAHGQEMDKTQIQPNAVGIREPFIAKPINMEQAKQNMRVEFRLVRVTAEVTKATDFDY